MRLSVSVRLLSTIDTLPCVVVEKITDEFSLELEESMVGNQNCACAKNFIWKQVL